MLKLKLSRLYRFEATLKASFQRARSTHKLVLIYILISISVNKDCQTLQTHLSIFCFILSGENLSDVSRKNKKDDEMRPSKKYFQFSFSFLFKNFVRVTVCCF
jgi:hypothetical protein